MPQSMEKSLFNEFIESTTLHGIRNAFTGDSKLRRFIWFLCVLCCFLIFVLNFRGLVISYISNELVSRVTIVNQENAVFPAVTICNSNPIRMRYLRSLNLPKSVISTVSEYGHGSPSHGDEDNLDLGILSGQSTLEVFKNASHQIADMLLNCTFLGKRCLPDDFDPIMTNMGVCYTFNTLNFEKRLATSARIVTTGENYGLTMKLNTEIDEYYAKIAEAVGFKVLIHAKDEFPLVDSNGFSVMPGVTTFAAIKKHKVITIPPDCENTERIGNYLYTKPFCHENCKIRYIAEHCLCYYVPVSDDLRPCSLYELFGCVQHKMQEFERLSKKNCSCPRSCERMTYDVRLSLAVFTTKNDDDLYLDDLDTSTYYRMIAEDNYARSNIVRMKVYFQDLNFHLVEDFRKYELHTLLSAAGGMLGLLLGASVITLAEFLDFFILLFKMKWSKTKVRTITVVEKPKEKL